jgi:hypothetical protein
MTAVAKLSVVVVFAPITVTENSSPLFIPVSGVTM